MPAKRRLPIVGKLSAGSIETATAQQASVAIGQGMPGMVGLAPAAWDWADSAIESAKEQFPPTKPLGCAAGCTACCHLKVATLGPTVIALAEHLEGALSAQALQALRLRVSQAHQKTHNLTTEARTWLHLPCPVLGDDGRCLGYEARPLRCRGANAFDRNACEAASAHPEVDTQIQHYPAQRLSAEAVARGLSRALDEAGLDPRPLELIAALELALSGPPVREAYWRGEPVFESAVDPESMG